MTTVKSSIKSVTNSGATLQTASSTVAGNAILRDGTHVHVRPIHPEDIELERHFIESLSPTSRRFRFLDTISSPSAALLKQMTVINPATDAAYIALLGTGVQIKEIGVARLSAQADGQDCEFALAVTDEWQHRGLGTLLMRYLIEDAIKRGIKTMHSSDSAANHLMRKFADHLHFEHQRDPEDATQVLYSVHLEPTKAIGSQQHGE